MLKTVPFKRTLLASMLTLASGAISAAYAAPATSPPATAPEQDKSKPNIVVIFGDDIGYWNLSTYNQGTMGYKTPNIDSIAAQGAKFTSYYAEQSSTAGRSSFITGQMPFRTGMSKVGMPGAPPFSILNSVLLRGNEVSPGPVVTCLLLNLNTLALSLLRVMDLPYLTILPRVASKPSGIFRQRCARN